MTEANPEIEATSARTAPRSRTQEITEQLRDEILRGQYREGERLPSERDLAARFGVNRAVASAALKKLDQLSIVKIEPGGARIAPIEHASLDVIGHLLDLDPEPRLDLVEQVLEAHRGLMAEAVRLAVRRASDAQIEHAIELTRQLAQPDLDFRERARIELESSKVFIDASQNLVLKLIHRTINTQFLERFQPMQEALSRPPRDVLVESVRKLIRGLEKRDAEGAAAALYSGMERIHEHWLRVLSTSREPQQPD